ncbi:MAG: FAD binding domain-containing protein [Myxococcota bacterium]
MSSRVLPRFDILNPQSVSEAVEMLSSHDHVSVLAGGTDMLIWNYIRKVAPAALLSLKDLQGLDLLEGERGAGLHLGAKAKVADLLTDGVVAERYRALYDAAYTFATPQIRNMATVVGNVMRGSPARDCSCAALALGGEVELEGPDGRRTDELAVGLRVREPGPDTRSAFHLLTRVHEDLARLNAAARLEVEDGVCREARTAMSCVGPTLVRLGPPPTHARPSSWTPSRPSSSRRSRTSREPPTSRSRRARCPRES